MTGPELAYLAFGLVLCALLVGAVVHYFSRKRRGQVESAKYKMLEDDDDR
jgi:cbb3-type cytochrome oxidase subunit 3